MVIFSRIVSISLILFLLGFNECFSAVKSAFYQTPSIRSVYQATSIFDVNQFYSIKIIPQMDNTVAVPVLINKRQSSMFLVDTGASYTVITPQLAKQLG